MGLTASSLNLTQYDIEDVQQHCDGKFTSREIQALYARFRSLDKRHKGFLTEDELMAIPELAISPLAPRIVQMFQNQNFKDFVKMLSALSPRASRDDRLRFMFQCHDVDRDGEIARSDLETMTRHLVGSSVSEEDFNALIHRAFEDLRAMRAERADAREGSARGVAFDEFRRALSAVDRTLPTVRVPVDDDA
ncbi:EF-Hand 1, calcium-binding site [Ostreococcus tauri]|uniref:EF-Hand 1, calcium-binding site n=1 Tax=Ostreococcus tauri TaxID=70448 RepID=Q00WG8_OSTTA|nr:EF-Hand 1, calcium-binding site [Ostreococcus tauri]CAL56790.1 EF-Hand 1, calcium-binding site [Ostreococcus tauri]|eukprot:XP_003082835.1 EF-Hand 1, calcium-binding site [Ostreococcus tauri]